MGASEWAMLLALSLLLGGSFFFFKVLVAEAPPFTVVLGRVGVAALALNGFLILRGDGLPREPRLWLAFLVMGLLNNVAPFSLIVFGETLHWNVVLGSVIVVGAGLFTIWREAIAHRQRRIAAR